MNRGDTSALAISVVRPALGECGLYSRIQRVRLSRLFSSVISRVISLWKSRWTNRAPSSSQKSCGCSRRYGDCFLIHQYRSKMWSPQVSMLTQHVHDTATSAFRSPCLSPLCLLRSIMTWYVSPFWFLNHWTCFVLIPFFFPPGALLSFFRTGHASPPLNRNQ